MQKSRRCQVAAEDDHHDLRVDVDDLQQIRMRWVGFRSHSPRVTLEVEETFDSRLSTYLHGACESPDSHVEC